MRSKRWKFWFAGAFVICLIATITTNCATTRLNLVDIGAIAVEADSHGTIYVSRVYVFQDGDGILITGNVKRRGSFGAGGGHVDVAILGPDGALIKELNTPFFPRIIPLKGARESSFSVRVPMVPPRGSMLRVAYQDA